MLPGRPLGAPPDGPSVLSVPLLLLLLLLPLTAQGGSTGMKFIGCFTDRSPGRDLPVHQVDIEDLTPTKCKEACEKAKGGPYRYFGLQDGNQCFCGSSYGQYGLSASCTKPCSGGGGSVPGSDGKCGGVFANDVYEIVPAGEQQQQQQQQQRSTAATGHTRTTYHPQLVGCFKDMSPGRQFSTDTQFDADEMSIDFCMKHCLDTGPYRYMALQDGNQCFCGNTPGDKLGKSSKCTKPCRGAPLRLTAVTCGGVFANQVYELIPKKEEVTTESHTAGPHNGAVCGVPGATLLVIFVVLSTGVANCGFFCSFVHLNTSSSLWVFVGCFAAEALTVVMAALLGNILPDSRLLSPNALRGLCLVLFFILGIVQVFRSFSIAGKDQEDRRDELRLAVGEVGRPRGYLEGSEDDTPYTESCFTACRVCASVLMVEWGSIHQIALTALAMSIDVRSVISGGLLGHFYSVSLAATCSPSTALAKNSTALKQTYVAGLCFIFLAMNHLFELGTA